MLKKLINKLLGKKEASEAIDSEMDLINANIPLAEKIDKMLMDIYGEKGLKKMKNFNLKLDSKRYKYQDLSFDTFNWTKQQEHLKENFIMWACNEYPIGMSLNFFNLQPNLPKQFDIDVIRDMYWEGGAAILKCDFVDIQGIPCVESLFKVVHEDHVVQYIMNLIIPFEDRSFVLKVFSEDFGDTGLRDSTVFPLVTKRDFFDNTDMTIYPYDENREGRMTLAEKEEYDYLLPFHHLTVLRKTIPDFFKTITLEGALKDLKPFYK
jgi:hypothetical protein